MLRFCHHVPSFRPTAVGWLQRCTASVDYPSVVSPMSPLRENKHSSTQPCAYVQHSDLRSHAGAKQQPPTHYFAPNEAAGLDTSIGEKNAAVVDASAAAAASVLPGAGIANPPSTNRSRISLTCETSHSHTGTTSFSVQHVTTWAHLVWRLLHNLVRSLLHNLNHCALDLGCHLHTASHGPVGNTAESERHYSVGTFAPSTAGVS